MTDLVEPINPLGTARYQDWRPAMGIAVATSVGKPRWMPGIEEVKGLAPHGLRHINNEFEFRLKYTERLNALEEEIHRDLIRLSRKYPNERLILLCWEDLRKPNLWCHRTLAAEWFAERGVIVPEMLTGEAAADPATASPARAKKPAQWPEDTLFDL